jgi:RNA-directed DNA polymerase
MLKIKQVKHLATALGTTPGEISEVLNSPSDFYEELILFDPSRPDKQRIVISVQGLMRSYQSRLYRRILLPKLSASAHSHGGVKDRSIKTNVEPHLGSRYAFKTDISNFFPSVHYKRVYKLFVERFECSPDVASLCTKICTFKHHLALGLVCSPILADQVLQRVDRRIAGACSKLNLVYTRYVDDVAISGAFDIASSGLPRMIGEILAKDGFKVNPLKHTFGRLSKDLSITSLREVQGHLDVRMEYLDELERQIADVASLANDGDFVGPYYTAEQILGRVRFVCWVNPRRRKKLIQLFRSVKWKTVRQIARKRGYEVSRKKLTKAAKSEVCE